MRRKTNICIFQATNKQNLTREDLNKAKKRGTLIEKPNLFQLQYKTTPDGFH